MTTRPNDNTNDHAAIPADLHDVEAALARAMRADRVNAPVGLEDRLFAASRSALPAPQLRLSEPLTPAQADMGRRIARHAFNSTLSRLRMAAAIALLVMGGLLALAILPNLRGTTSSTNHAHNPSSTIHLADSDVADSVLSALALSENSSFSTELESIRTAAEALDQSIQSDGLSILDLSETGV